MHTQIQKVLSFGACRGTCRPSVETCPATLRRLSCRWFVGTDVRWFGDEVEVEYVGLHCMRLCYMKVCLLAVQKSRANILAVSGSGFLGVLVLFHDCWSPLATVSHWRVPLRCRENSDPCLNLKNPEVMSVAPVHVPKRLADFFKHTGPRCEKDIWDGCIKFMSRGALQTRASWWCLRVRSPDQSAHSAHSIQEIGARQGFWRHALGVGMLRFRHPLALICVLDHMSAQATVRLNTWTPFSQLVHWFHW